MKYTEKDFQDYVAGNFNGNRKVFEKWLEENADAAKILKQYNSLFTGLKNQPEYKMSFNLEDKVMKRLQARTVVKKQGVYALNGILIVAIVAVLVVSWRMADFSNIQIETGLFAGAAIITLCFAAALHLLELNRRKEKFKMLLG